MNGQSASIHDFEPGRVISPNGVEFSTIFNTQLLHGPWPSKKGDVETRTKEKLVDKNPWRLHVPAAFRYSAIRAWRWRLIIVAGKDHDCQIQERYEDSKRV